MLIVADPAGSHPAARREGRDVLRFMREANPSWRIRYLSRQVSCADLDDELPDTDIFHIAAHMDDAPPGVRMADGLWLPAPDSVAPGMVVAACCHAGGLASAGRELAGRFLRAGTRQVIAPYAAVSDRLGEFFSSELYREIAAGGTLASAALAARKTLGPAGLVFIHYGTMLEQFPLSVASAPETTKEKRKRPVLIGISLLALAALLAVSFWFGRTAKEGREETARPIAAETRHAETAELTEPLRQSDTKTENSAETTRKNARRRVSEKCWKISDFP